MGKRAKSKTERMKFREFCEFVLDVVKLPPLPHEPEGISQLREDIKEKFKNANDLFVLFNQMDESVAYDVRVATEELQAYYESQVHREAGKPLN